MLFLPLNAAFFGLIQPNILASSLSITPLSPHLTSPVSLSAPSIHSCLFLSRLACFVSLCENETSLSVLFVFLSLSCFSFSRHPPSLRLMSLISSQESEPASDQGDSSRALPKKKGTRLGVEEETKD